MTQTCIYTHCIIKEDLGNTRFMSICYQYHTVMNQICTHGLWTNELGSYHILIIATWESTPKDAPTLRFFPRSAILYYPCFSHAGNFSTCIMLYWGFQSQATAGGSNGRVKLRVMQHPRRLPLQLQWGSSGDMRKLYWASIDIKIHKQC